MPWHRGEEYRWRVDTQVGTFDAAYATVDECGNLIFHDKSVALFSNRPPMVFETVGDVVAIIRDRKWSLVERLGKVKSAAEGEQEDG